MKFCPNCGKEIIIENIKFCYECGYKLPILTEQASTEPLKFKIENENLISYNGDDKNIILPKGIKTLKSYAFCNVNANNKEIILSDSIESIEEKAFYAVPNIEKIFISKSVKNINEKAFYVGFDNSLDEYLGCISLKEIIVDENNPYFKSVDGNLYSKDGKTLIKYATGKTDEEFIIPEGVVKTSSYSTLVDCGHLKKVVLPASFGDEEFILFVPNNENSFIDIEINKNNPNYKVVDGNVVSKDETVFVMYNKKYNAENFIVPKNIKKIDNCAFTDSPLENIILPNGITEIGESAFEYCYNLKNIILPNTIKSISTSAFSLCENLENINLPNCLERIESHIFENSGLINIDIPNSVKEIDDYAFLECNLEKILIPSSVTRLGEYCFCGCYNLKEVTLNNGLKVIDTGAFSDCRSLENIKIPSTVEIINEEVFVDCSNLKKIYIAKGKTYKNLPSKIKIVEY